MRATSLTKQFADKVATIKSNDICRTEVNLGARAVFCYGDDDSELLVLRGGVVSAILLHNWAYGPNGGEHDSIQLAKVVFNADPESAPVERPKDTESVLQAQQSKSTTAMSGDQLTKYKAYKSALRERADKGDPDAQYDLALLYEFPLDGTPPNRSGAGYWYKRAAARGHVRAMYRLGLYYYDQGSDTEAYNYFEKAAKIGFPPAMTKLGEMTVRENLKGNGTYYGLPWMEKAAKAGDPDAENDLGRRAWELYQNRGREPQERY